MKTLDAVLQEAESEAQKLLGSGFSVSIHVERTGSRERQAGAQRAASDLPLLSVKQAAEMLGMSQSTVRSWCRDGTLPARKIGRSWFVSRVALERLGNVASMG